MKITSTQLKNLIREEAKKIHEQEDDAAATADDAAPITKEPEEPEESEEKLTGFDFELIKKQLGDKKPDLNKKELSAHYYDNGVKGSRFGIQVTPKGIKVNGKLYAPVQIVTMPDVGDVTIRAEDLRSDPSSTPDDDYVFRARGLSRDSLEVKEDAFFGVATLYPRAKGRNIFSAARDLKRKGEDLSGPGGDFARSFLPPVVYDLGGRQPKQGFKLESDLENVMSPDEFIEMIKAKVVILSMDEGDYTGIMKGDPFTYSYFPATKEFKVTGLSSKGEKVKGKRRARYDKAIGRVGKEGSKLHKVLTRRMKSPNAPAEEEETAAGEEEQTNESVKVRKIRRLIRDEIELIKRT